MKLSLRRKMVGGFGLLLAFIVLLGWVTLSLLGSLGAVQRRVFNDAIPGLVAVDEIVRSYTSQSSAIRGYLIATQPSLLEQYDRELAAAAIAEAEARRLFDSEREERTLDELVAAGERFHVLVEEQIIPLAEEGRRSLAFSVLIREGVPLISEIEQRGSILRTLQDRVVVTTEQQASASSQRTLIIVSLVFAGTLAIGTFVAWILPRRLEQNLTRLVEAARAIGRGDFDQRLEIRSGDEVEELAQRFTEMQAGLKRLQQLALQDRELEIAAQIQRNLLQRSLPQVPGLRIVPVQHQANLVGGDWYDVDVTGNLLTVAVGDASGKGIAAALMATVVLSVLRAERRLGSPPKSVVERANDALLQATESDAFTTLTYATIDVASGETHWLNMGHPAPFVLRAQALDDDHRGYYMEGPRNRVLGWFEDPGLTETVVRLEPGDRLFFYTDGFLEAKSPQGEVLGEHRFAELLLRLAPLDTAALLDEAVREAERFAAGKLDDDLTMLVVEFMGEPAPGGDGAAPEEATRGEEPWHSRR